MKSAWIGLGGNIGDVKSNMRAALDHLEGVAEIELGEVSSLYETPPWGRTDQPRFLNACATLRTNLTPSELLAALHAVEALLKRERRERWGPRTIDLDLLAYEGFASAEDALSVPHPRIAERAFVLVPLAEIAPDLEIEGEKIADLATRITRGDMEIVASDWR